MVVDELNTEEEIEQYSKDSALARAPKTLKLLERNGKYNEYTCIPLSDKDIIELDEWLRDRFIQQAYFAAESLPQEAGDRIIKIALKEAISLSWISNEGRALVATIEGITRIFFQALDKTKHSNVKVPQHVRYLFTNSDNIKVVWRRLIVQDLMSGKEADKKKGELGNSEGQGSQENLPNQ